MAPPQGSSLGAVVVGAGAGASAPCPPPKGIAPPQGSDCAGVAIYALWCNCFSWRWCTGGYRSGCPVWIDLLRILKCRRRHPIKELTVFIKDIYLTRWRGRTSTALRNDGEFWITTQRSCGLIDRETLGRAANWIPQCNRLVRAVPSGFSLF